MWRRAAIIALVAMATAWMVRAQGGNYPPSSGTGTTTNQVAKGIPTNSSGTSTAIDSVVCTPPATNGQYTVGYTVTASAAVAPSCPQVGVAERVISGATSSDTIGASTINDAQCIPIVHDQAATGTVAFTLPTPTTLANPNACILIDNHSAQTDTVTPTTFTIINNRTAAGASISLAPGSSTRITVDPFNASTWDAVTVNALGISVFPLTVSGTVNSGGIPCFTSATNEASSATLTGGNVLWGGGAGVCPSDNSGGSTITAAGGFINLNTSFTVSLQSLNDVGTGDGDVMIQSLGASGWSLFADNANSKGAGIETRSALPVIIAPNKTITELFQSGGGQKTSGTAPTCTFSTGGGTSPSCTLDTGSNSEAGIIIATTGTGSPGATGTITLTFPANLGTNKPVCNYQASDAGTGAWSSLPVMKDKTPAIGSDLFTWTNGTSNAAATALTASTAYWINYHCFGK